MIVRGRSKMIRRSGRRVKLISTKNPAARAAKFYLRADVWRHTAEAEEPALPPERPTPRIPGRARRSNVSEAPF